jgi:RNA 2',3'-cyclic 3'-phosphodiesterase
MTGLRTFVAVPLPGPVQSVIFEAAQSLSGVLPPVKWSRKAENLHVTVKFLGQVAEDRVHQLGTALDAALGRLPRFSISVRGLGAFPRPRAARIVWAGVDDPTQGLATVAAAVEDTAARLGFARAERPFRAHVTVGRSKEPVDAGTALAGWTERRFAAVTVDEVHLYESRLGGEGSTYVLRARAALAVATPN